MIEIRNQVIYPTQQLWRLSVRFGDSGGILAWLNAAWRNDWEGYDYYQNSENVNEQLKAKAANVFMDVHAAIGDLVFDETTGSGSNIEVEDLVEDLICGALSHINQLEQCRETGCDEQHREDLRCAMETLERLTKVCTEVWDNKHEWHRQLGELYCAQLHNDTTVTVKQAHAFIETLEKGREKKKPKKHQAPQNDGVWTDVPL